jgi:hypothetical protein
LFTFCLAGILYLLDDLVEVAVEPFDLLCARLQPFLGLEVAAVGEDRPDLGPALRLEVVDDLAPDLAVVEELELRVRPLQDLVEALPRMS